MALDISHILWEYVTFYFHQASGWLKHFEVSYILPSLPQLPPQVKWWGHDPHGPRNLNPGHKDTQMEDDWGWVILLAASSMRYSRNSWSWEPWSCPSWFLLRLLFFFNSAFSCMISISYLTLELARISFCCLQAKDHNRNKWQHKMFLSAVPDSSELGPIVLMWAVRWFSAPTSFPTYSAVKPLILQWTVCWDIIYPLLGAKILFML